MEVSRLQEALHLPLGSSKEAASVYSLVHNRPATRYPKRTLRDLIVWRCCGDVGFGNRDASFNGLDVAFGRSLERDLLSKMLLAYASIMWCLGRPDEFSSNNTKGASKGARRNRKRAKKKTSEPDSAAGSDEQKPCKAETTQVFGEPVVVPCNPEDMSSSNSWTLVTPCSTDQHAPWQLEVRNMIL